MKKLLKTIPIVVLVFVILGLANAVSAFTAPTGSIQLRSDSASYTTGKTVTVTLSFPTFTFDEDVVVARGKVSYDTSKLQLESMSTTGIWSPITEGPGYNKTSGKFTLTADKAPAAGSDALIIKFTVKDNAAKGETPITIENVDILGGDFSVTPVSIKISEPAKDPDDDNQGGQGGNQGGNQGDDKESSSNKTADGVVSIPAGTENSITGTKLDPSSDIYAEMKAKLLENGYNNIFCAYELTVTGSTKNGITLTFNLGAENNGKQAMVLHKKSNGEYETFTATVKNGKISITVKEFSPFMVALKDKVDNNSGNKKEDNLPDSTLPDTGESGNPILVTLLVVAIGAAIVFFVKIKLIDKKSIKTE